MESAIQKGLDGYISLFDMISERVENDAIAIAILQEMSKDRRSQQMQGERSEKDTRPATAKQKDYLRKLGITFPEDISKVEASALIDEGLAKNGD